ncbi:MAG: (2Fe-2S)-binding protein [Ilumatobacteraceae bacterium]|nr:(2Fe-2S)-binding protein [Ilumatobacteraceae bacterium]
MKIASVVNGKRQEMEVADNTLLLDWLRNELGLTGTKQSCEVQVCGVCTVLIDGVPVSGCTTLAVEARDSDVTTIEGLRGTDFYKRAEGVFMRHSAVQCGFCSPGFILTVYTLVNAGRKLSQNEIKEALNGNLCRCTGYKSIIEAAVEVIGAELARKI